MPQAVAGAPRMVSKLPCRDQGGDLRIRAKATILWQLHDRAANTVWTLNFARVDD